MLYITNTAHTFIINKNKLFFFLKAFPSPKQTGKINTNTINSGELCESYKLTFLPAPGDCNKGLPSPPNPNPPPPLNF